MNKAYNTALIWGCACSLIGRVAKAYFPMSEEMAYQRTATLLILSALGVAVFCAAGMIINEIRKPSQREGGG